MTKCKTEKRKENVGERILITNVDVNETRYENGAVLDVIDSQGRVVHDKRVGLSTIMNTKSSSENTSQHRT